MNRKERRKALVTEARQIHEKASVEGRDLTTEEIDRATAIKSEVEQLGVQIKAEEDAKLALKSIVAGGDDDDENDEDQVTKSDDPRRQVLDRKGSGIQIKDREPAEDFGTAFIKSAAYKAFQKKNPSGLGAGSHLQLEKTHIGSFKNLMGAKDLLTTDVARLQPVRYPTLNMIDRPRLTLLDIIGSGEMAGNFEYVQIVGVTRNSAIVEEATGAVDGTTGADLDPLKPLSDFQTQLADAKSYTYADGYEVTNQMLSDAPAFAQYLNTELGYSIRSVIEQKILSGTGINGEPRGIFATTGVQIQPMVTDMVTTVRKAITRVTRVGGQVTGVVMSPEHDEQWDLLQDGNQRYYGNGPFGTGPGTAWGRPRIVSELLSGTNDVIVGDFSTVALLDREGLSIEAFTQHKDYAQRNKVYVRAELRAGQVIWRPNRLVRATVPAA